MKRLLLLFLLFILCCKFSFAQIPFLGITSRKNNYYAYHHFEFTPNKNNTIFYSINQFGISDKFDGGVEILSSASSLSQGFVLKHAFVSKDYLNAALQTTSFFNIDKGYDYAWQNVGLYLNGCITHHLSYVSNTFMDVTNKGDISSYQFWYLSYAYKSISPYVGLTHNWTDEFDANLALGLCYNVGKLNFYAWGGNMTRGKPKFTVGLDYCFAVK